MLELKLSMVVQRVEALDQGRESFRRQAWGSAYSQLGTADRQAPLEPDDLQQLAIAAHLTGRESDSAAILVRAHQGYLGRADPQGAARCAFWLGFSLLNSGEPAQAGGWFARARRLLEDSHQDCVEQGYLLLPA